MISIIIPTFNEEKTVEASIKAIKNGLTLPHEVIVSDGGSADKTVEIAKKYADKVIVGELGVSKQRNRGAREAAGEFLAFIDSAGSTIGNPDIFFTRALEDFENPHIVAVSGPQRVTQQFETGADRIIYALLNAGFRFSNNVVHVGAASGKFQMMRAEVFRKTTGFREDMVAAEDNEMFKRMSKIGRTYFDPRLVVFHENRRARKIGWPRLLLSWGLNTIWLALFNTSFSKEWKNIR